MNWKSVGTQAFMTTAQEFEVEKYAKPGPGNFCKIFKLVQEFFLKNDTQKLGRSWEYGLICTEYEITHSFSGLPA